MFSLSPAGGYACPLRLVTFTALASHDRSRARFSAKGILRSLPLWHFMKSSYKIVPRSRLASTLVRPLRTFHFFMSRGN